MKKHLLCPAILCFFLLVQLCGLCACGVQAKEEESKGVGTRSRHIQRVCSEDAAAVTSEPASEFMPEPSQEPAPTAEPEVDLNDGIYNIILYRDLCVIAPEGTYATVSLEEDLTFSDAFVNSLQIGDEVEGITVESRICTEEYYGTIIEIDSRSGCKLFKGNDDVVWKLLDCGIPVSRITKQLSVFFPIGSLYIDRRTAFNKSGVFQDIELDRIEDYFDDDTWPAVTMSITVENGTITEAVINYSPVDWVSLEAVGLNNPEDPGCPE